MATALTPHQKRVLSQASREQIIQALGEIKRAAGSTWLPSEHPFPMGILPRRWRDVRRREHPAIVRLMAVSGPNHAIDGWGFLARSLASLIAGDAHAARHFAYYAELRAALSILSIFGIGVFNSWNCVVDSAGRLVQLDDLRQARPLGTHSMAWLALEEWASGPDAGALIGDALSIRKVTFDDSLRAMWPGTASRPIASDLILAWGVDLKRAIDDRGARNTSSYIAQALSVLPCSADETLDFLLDFWDLFEPDPGDPFLALDRHLFRLTVETQYHAVGGTPHRRVTDIGRRYANLDSAVQAVISRDFLTRTQFSDNPALISKAKSRSVISHPAEMISRAALLLRSATAMVTKALFDAGVSGETDLQFWFGPYGENLGFWTEVGPPNPMHELWADVRQALDDAEATRSSCSRPFRRADWASSGSNGLPRIFEAERIALWSLCS